MKLSKHPIFPLLNEIASLLEWKSSLELDMPTATRILDFAEAKGWKNDLEGFCSLLHLKAEQPGFDDWVYSYPKSA